MNKIVKRSRWLSILTTLVVFSAWFSISNHCALNAAAAPPADSKMEQEQCPFHRSQSKPVKQKSPGETPCCKILRAIASRTPAQNFWRSAVDLAKVDFSFPALIVLPAPRVTFRSVTLATGPPGTTLFVQLIGSIHTHAPPLLG